MLSSIDFTQRNHVLTFALICSALLSIVVSWHSIPNPDGMVYITAANAFLQNGYHAAANVYIWPLFPIILAAMHQTLGLTYEHAALIWTTLSYALLIYSFIRLSSLVNKTHYQCALIAAICIVSHPLINSSRDMIIRDPSYWACLCYGLYQLFSYHRRPSLLCSLKWHVAMAVAILFRVEAIVFWLGLSLLSGWQCRHNIIAALRMTGPLFILILLSIALTVVSHAYHIADPARINTLLRWLSFLSWAEIFRPFLSVADGYQATYALKDYYPMESSHIVIASGLLIVFAYKTITTTQLVFFVPGIMGLKNAYHTWHRCDFQLIIISLLLALTIPSLFYLKHLFINFRYLIPVALCFMILAVPILSKLLLSEKITNQKKHFWRIITIALIVFAFVDGVISFGTNKMYLKEAGLWINTHAKPNARIFTNNRQIAFYINRDSPGYWRDLPIERTYIIKSINSQTIIDFDYIVLQISHHDLELNEFVSQHQSSIVKLFQNNRHDQIYILKKIL